MREDDERVTESDQPAQQIDSSTDVDAANEDAWRAHDVATADDVDDEPEEAWTNYGMSSGMQDLLDRGVSVSAPSGLSEAHDLPDADVDEAPAAEQDHPSPVADTGADATGDSIDPHQAAPDIDVETARAEVEEALRQGEAMDAARAEVVEAFRQAEVERTAQPNGQAVPEEPTGMSEADLAGNQERSDEEVVSLPVPMDDIDERTDDYRINLADDVPDVLLVPTYDGYLDVVMHGDALGTQAAIGDDRVDFTLDQTAGLIASSDSWDGRPVRMLSCSVGEADFSQDLADRLQVPVYAPDDVLSVAGGVKTVLHGGSYRRFEPR